MSVWIPCMSQHDFTMYEANGSRDPQFQQQVVTVPNYGIIE
jgi:hypothetical protein